MARDTRRDEGQYYPYGKRVLPPGYQPDDDVKHSDFDGVEPLPERFNDDDVRTKINTVINALKGASAAVVMMLLGATAFGAGVTVQTAPKGRIYNDEQIVTNVVFDATGLATTQEVESVSNDVAALSDSVETNAADIAKLADTTATLSDSIEAISATVETNAAAIATLANATAALSDSVETNAAAIATLVDTTATLSDSIVTGISNLSTRVEGKVEQTDFDAATNSIAGAIAPLAGIPALIPAQASPTNQLADKQFVNSSIATSTANFCGTSAATDEDAFVEWLEAIEVANDNDYVFWQTEDGDGNAVFKRYKYVEDPSGLGEEALAGHWLFEYDLNNSSFTAVQWAAINSGVTSETIGSTAAALESLRTGKADDNAVVKLSGDQMIFGDKTFQGNTQFDGLISGGTSSGPISRWQLGDDDLGGYLRFTRYLELIPSTTTLRPDIGGADWQDHTILLPTKSGTAALTSDIPDVSGKADATNVYTKAEMDAWLDRRGVEALRDMESRFYVVTTNIVVSPGDDDYWICDWDGVTLDKNSILTWRATVGGVYRVLLCEPLDGNNGCCWLYNPNAKMMGGVPYQTNGSIDDTVLDFAISDDEHLTFTRVMTATNIVVTTNYVIRVTPVDIPAGSTDVDAHGCVHNAPVELGLGAKATVDLSGLSSNAIVRSVSTAIGPGADASNPDNPSMQQGIAVGNQARAKGTNAIAIGAGIRHEDEDDLTGDNAYAGANEAIAGGYSAKATASQAVALGSRARAHAQGAWQLGEGVNSNRNTLAFRDYKLLGEDGQVPYERVAGAVAQAGVEFEAAVSNAVRRILAGGNMTLVCDGSEGEQILEPKVAGLSEVQFLTNTNGVHEASTLGYLDPPPLSARNYDVLISEIPEPMWMGTNEWETVALENRLNVHFTELPPQYDVSMHVDESCGFQRSGRAVSITNAPTVVKLREISTNKVLVVVKPYRLEDL